MAYRRYRMTPARARALKAAQAASARKRKGTGKAKVNKSGYRRHRKKIAIGAIAAVGLAGGAYAASRKRRGKSKQPVKKKRTGTPQGKRVLVHHITRADHVSSIERRGLKGSNYGPQSVGHGKVHVTTNIKRTRGQAVKFRGSGTAVVSTVVKRKHLRPDANEGGGHNMVIDPANITGPVRRMKKRKKVSANPYRSTK